MLAEAPVGPDGVARLFNQAAAASTQ